MTTDELKKRLAAYFAGDAFAVIWEVGNSTGFACDRHCDALVQSCFPSRGLDLMGCELKVSRSDWLRELKNPKKAESIYQYCDRWWLVAGDNSIVRQGELPTGWGLMLPTKAGNLRIKEPAAKLEPKPLAKTFLAAIIRQACKQSTSEAQLKAAREAARQEGIAHGQRGVKNLAEQYGILQKKVREFEAASGLHIEFGWKGPTKIGEAVQAILDGDLLNYGGLVKSRNLAASFVRDVDQICGLMPKRKLRNR